MNSSYILSLMFLIALANIKTVGQSVAEHPDLSITYSKTTSIIFPSSIQSVDRGSKDVLAQKVNGVKNILQVKAARKRFQETNLTVVTSNGTLHHFNVAYSEDPKELAFVVSEKVNKDLPAEIAFDDPTLKVDLMTTIQSIRNEKGSNLAGKRRNKITFVLRGIYIQDNVIYYRFKIRNRSNINYDIQSLRFFIEDKRQAKRTTHQEIEMLPLTSSVSTENTVVPGRSSLDAVYALEKFTIPDAKRVAIKLFEGKGGRHAKLRISNNLIVNASLIKTK
jgi:conjugative transposon TraN protein